MSSDHHDDCSPADITGHRVFLSHGDDGFLVAHCTALPGVVAQGFGRKRTLEAMETAIRVQPINRNLEQAVEHFQPTPTPKIVADQFGSAPRASIVTFLTSEAARCTHEGQRAFRRNDDDGCQRLRAAAAAIRTLATQIARGDDRLGGGQ